MNLTKSDNIRSSLSFAMLFGFSLVFLFMTGCKDDLTEEEGYDGRPKDSYSVSIALAGMGNAQTRAENGEWQESIDDEYFIDINDLYIMTFSIPEGATELAPDSKLLEVLWNGKEKGKSKGSGIHYNGHIAYLYTWLHHTINEYKDGKNFCLVAFSNSKQFSKADGRDFELSKNMTFSALQSMLKYDFKPNANVANGDMNEWYWYPYTETEGKRTANGIPLFGVKRVNLKGYDKSIHNFANPFMLYSNGSPAIWMMRAFSKIELDLHPDLYDSAVTNTDVRIISATVNNNYASEFWIIPELDRIDGFKKSNGEGTGGTGENGYVTKVPGDDFKSSPSPDNEPIHFVVNEDARSAFIFLPESYLGIEADNALEVSLTLQIGDKTKTLPSFTIRNYPQTEQRNDCWIYLLRNHIYRFRVSLDKVFSVEPQPWENAFDNEFTFGNPKEDIEEEQPEQEEN